VVFTASRRTFRAGGYGVGRFCAAIAAEYARIERMQQPGGALVLRDESELIDAPARRLLAFTQPNQVASLPQ
jgi:hypothetical protein